MIPLARWLCKIARHTSHTVQRERSEKATRRKGEGGEPLIHKQALDGAPSDTGPTSRLPETVPLQNKNGRSQDESRIPHVDPAWAAFLQQPDGGPIMCGEVHHRGDCRASPQRADRTQQSSGKNDPNIASMLGSVSSAKRALRTSCLQLVRIVLISFIRSLSYPEPRRHQNQTS
jgi:hypothetical protein